MLLLKIKCQNNSTTHKIVKNLNSQNTNIIKMCISLAAALYRFMVPCLVIMNLSKPVALDALLSHCVLATTPWDLTFGLEPSLSTDCACTGATRTCQI